MLALCFCKHWISYHIYISTFHLLFRQHVCVSQLPYQEEEEMVVLPGLAEAAFVTTSAGNRIFSFQPISWKRKQKTVYVLVKCRDNSQPTAGFFQRCVGTIYSYKSGVFSEMSGQFAADNWQHITAHK